MTQHRDHHHDDTKALKLAKTAALVVGGTFLLVGILGFIPGITTNTDQLSGAGHHSEAKLLGLFQVSVLHNIVHLLFGVVGVAVAARPRIVPTYLVGGGIVYAALTVYGFVIDQSSDANFVPVNTADNWLHAGLAVGMVGLGLFVRKALAEHGTPTRP